MATKKRFTKWRISDVLEAVALDRGTVRASYDLTRGECARDVIDDLRLNPTTTSGDAIARWYYFLPASLGLAQIDPRNSAAVESVAAALVAEARRLNVPKRAR